MTWSASTATSRPLRFKIRPSTTTVSTSDGRALLPFHANLLQAAISSGAPVLPAALRFAESATGETSFAPSYIGDERLLDSVWRTLRAPPLTAFVRFGEPQSPQGRDRRMWAQTLHADIDTLRSQTLAAHAES